MLRDVIWMGNSKRKKSKTGIKTPKPEVDLVRRRYKEAQELAKNRNP